MADPALQTFDAKKAELARQRTEHLAALRKIEDRLEFLEDLRAEVAASNGKPKPRAGITEEDQRDKNEELQSPSQAIIGYVSSHPDATKVQVIDAILGHIRTQSKKPKEMIGTMIYQLVKRGTLIRKQGKLRAAEKPAE